MKYRIKVTTYNNGRKTYSPQYKTFLFWAGLGYEGDTMPFSLEFSSRETALESIDKHFGGNTKVQTIEFEYITK